MISKETYNLSVSYLKTPAMIEKIQRTENLNYLWEIAQELNNNKFLSNKNLSTISYHIYNLKKRRNRRKLEEVKGIILNTIKKIK